MTEPLPSGAVAAAEPHPIRFVVTDDLKRSRLTTLFRLVLAIPHFLWIYLWQFVFVFALMWAWFVALIFGRLEDDLHSFLARYVRYSTHLYAYLFLLANVLLTLAQVLAFVGWFVALFTGKLPQGMRDLSAFCLRYYDQTMGYLLLLTQRYPSLSGGPSA